MLDVAVDALAALVVTLHEQTEAAGRRRADRAARPTGARARTARRTARRARAGVRTGLVGVLPARIRSGCSSPAAACAAERTAPCGFNHRDAGSTARLGLAG